MSDVGPLVWCAPWCELVELWACMGACLCMSVGGGSERDDTAWCGVLSDLGVSVAVSYSPQPIGCSTIGAAGLSFQVRKRWAFPVVPQFTTSLCVHHCPRCLFVWGGADWFV